MRTKIVVDQTGTVAYDSQTKAAMVLAEGPKHSTAPLKASTHMGYGDIYPWGTTNMRPQEIIKAAKKNTIIPSTLSWKAEALYGGGVWFGFIDHVDDKEKLIPAERGKYPDIENFIFSRTTRRYCRQAAKAYYWWKWIVPEIIVSRDRKKVVSLASQRPEYSRYERATETDQISNILINANWDLGESSKSSNYSTPVPMLDPYGDPVEQLKEAKGHKFIYPVDDPSPGDSLYPVAEWHTVIESGWLKVVEKIPVFKTALFENQITIKYLIEVSTWWWAWKYPGFETYDATRKQEVMSAELNKFLDFVQGTEKSGRAIMVTFHSDPQLQKNYEGWKITPIENKVAEGLYNADSQEGASHIMYALSVDPVLRGFTPGAKLASGGSEKRVAWNNYLMTTKPHQDDILEPLHFIKDFNGWDTNIRFWFKNYYQTTLDVAKEPQQMTT